MAAFILLVGVVLLNSALTMANSWPTAWVRPTALLAPELVLLVLAMAVLVGFAGRLRPAWQWLATAVVLLLMGGRYAIVTTEGLFGRPVNLYWEAVRLPDVAALLLDTTPPWLIAGSIGAGAAALLTLIMAVRWCVRAVARGLEGPVLRKWAVRVCIVLLAGFVVAQGQSSSDGLFARPVSPAYARQVGLVFDHARNPRLSPAVDATPAVDGDWFPKRDIYVVFFESYGATVFDDPARDAELDGAYGALERILEETAWTAVSAAVDSTTFGGASWLAHTSLLSGRQIGDQRDYLTLIESGRPLLSHDFRAAGYRTIALMPGITQEWPEGAAFGYDRIYDAETIGYDGPRFGWWEIPDQYSLAFLQRQEIDVADRAPLFVLHPTVMSHMPFSPTPPYSEDWGQLAATLDGANVEEQADSRSAAYVAAVQYNLAVLGGFLRRIADDDAVIVVLGDHQPPALITGANASWAVPVHVFASDRKTLDGFVGVGFQSGLRPVGPAIGSIAELTPLVRAAAQAD